jgi:hypothetical protein
MLSQFDWDLSAPAAAATAAAAAATAGGAAGGGQHMHLLNAQQQLLVQQQHELQLQQLQLQQQQHHHHHHLQRVRSWGSGDASSSNCSMTAPALAGTWQALAGSHPNTAAAAAASLGGDLDVYTRMAQHQAPAAAGASAQQQLGGCGAVLQAGDTWCGAAAGLHHGGSACGGVPGTNGFVQPAAAVAAAGALELTPQEDDCLAQWLEGPLHEDERSLVDLLLN